MSFLAAIPVIGALIDSIGAAVDRNVTTDQERLKMKAEMMSLMGPVIQVIVQAQAAFDETRFKMASLELQSADRFVRWTRPAMTWVTFLMWGYTMITHHPQTEFAFYAFGLVSGLFSATRGIEKIADKWPTADTK